MHIEQNFSEVKASKEEQEVLQELETSSLDKEKYNKILAQKKRYYHNKSKTKLVSKLQNTR